MAKWLLFAFILLSVCASAQIPSGGTFGLDYNQTSPNWPSDITHSCGRFWDLAGVLWDEVETSKNVFNWKTMDAELEIMAKNNVNCAHIVLARTPSFASTNWSSSHGITCHSATGLCDPPSDITLTGTGANLFFRNWVAALASHVNQPGYITGTGVWAGHPHAHLYIYETWNEPDSQEYWTGSYDQLIRLEWDVRCIVKGCTTNPITGETGAQVRATVTNGAGSSVVDTKIWPGFPANPLDPTATIVMPSYHAPAFTLSLAQAFLYCTGAQTNWHPPMQSCTHGTAGSDGTDAINMHMKWGNNWPTELEPTVDAWVGGVNAALSKADKAKPLYNTEGGASGGGFTFGPYVASNPANEASFVIRNYLYGCNGNLMGECVWYNWSHGNIGSSTADAAYTQVFKWMSGNTEGVCTHNLTVYQCPFTGPNGYVALAVWGISGTNSTFQVPANTYSTYTDYTGVSRTLGSTVTIGYSPVLLVGKGSSGSAPPSPKSLTATVH